MNTGEPQQEARFRAWLRAWFVLALLLLAPARVAGAEPESGGLPAVVNVGGSGLDQRRVKSAVEQELGVSLRIDPASETRLEVIVTGRRAHVTYYAPGREPVTRSVDLPRDAERATETIAFLSGNLARDEAQALLDQLRARESAPPPPAPPPEAAKASAVPAASPAAETPAEAKPKPSPSPEPRAKEPALIDSRVNLSFFHPLTILPNTEQRRLKFELGLVYSRVGAIKGFGFSFGHLRSEGPVKGFSYALVWNRSGPVRGVSMASIYNEGYGKVEGLSSAALVNYRDGDVAGVQLAGIFGWASRVQGVQLSGIAGLSRSLDGGQVAGIFARSSEDARGAQVAGILSMAKDVTGFQLAGITNLAADVTGAQIGSVNVARNVRGIQIGVVNVAERIDGGAIGLVNIAGNGRIQPLAWVSGGVALAANAGVKFVTGYTYSYVGAGHDFSGDRYRLEGGAGLHVPFSFLFAEAGVAYAQESLDNGLDQEPLRQELRYDGRLGADLGSVSPFVGGGFSQRLTGQGQDFRGHFALGVGFL